jgi:hypothetical protein
LSKIHLQNFYPWIFPYFLAKAEKKVFFCQKMAEHHDFWSFFAQIDDILGNKMTKNENFEKSPREVLDTT